jgi:hypothetical protein
MQEGAEQIAFLKNFKYFSLTIVIVATVALLMANPGTVPIEIS